MKQLVGQTNLSRIFLLLLLVSPHIYAQDDSKEEENNIDCPTTIPAWYNYVNNESNNPNFMDCNNWLKTKYMVGEELPFMKQNQMKRVLVDRYEKIIAYYRQPGKDEGMANVLEEELEDLKKITPAKPKKTPKAETPDGKQKKDNTDDGNI
jgi:hypothetical protein